MFALGFLAPGGAKATPTTGASTPSWTPAEAALAAGARRRQPVVAAVNRAKVSVRAYDLLAKWLAVGYRYVEKYALPQMPAATARSSTG